MIGIEVKDIKGTVRRRVHRIAAELDWPHLTLAQRRQYYEAWATDPAIGGQLALVMEPERIRVYLKDSVMKTFRPAQARTIRELLASMSLPCEEVTREFSKPQSILCGMHTLYTLTKAKDWKVAVMSAFERSCDVRGILRNVVFVTEHTTGRYVDQSYRDLISAAANRLGIELVWIV